MRNFIHLFSFFLILFITSCSTSNSSLKGTEEDPAYLIAQMVLEHRDKLPHQSIAVIEFSDINGNPLERGKLLAEKVITFLVQSGKVKVVERSKVNKVLEEQKLGLSGITDQANTRRLGRILNVDALLTGTMALVNGTYEINARIVDTETALVLAATLVHDKAGTGESPVPAILKGPEEKSGKTPRVDVIEYKIEKNKEGLGKGYGTVKIIGKAVYIPDPEEDKSFKDLIGMPVFNLLDSGGKKVMEFKGGFKCGEYGSEENITPNAPFPFVAEDGLVKYEFWNKISSCQFVRWGFVK